MTESGRRDASGSLLKVEQDIRYCEAFLAPDSGRRGFHGASHPPSHSRSYTAHCARARISTQVRGDTHTAAHPLPARAPAPVARLTQLKFGVSR
jgi:hypothetical protein